MSDAIKIDSVVKCYGENVAVNGLSLTVRHGELFAFLGPNGAGKTTTIKMIAGLLTPTEGTVSVCGHLMGSDGLLAKAQMAYVPDQPFLYEKLTGREFLHFVAEMYGIDNRERDRVLGMLTERLDIAGFLDQLTGSYSHGMKQRVVLAAAMLHQPRVLVVDEPMIGLDPRTARSVKDLFVEITQSGDTVFMSTHTLEVAEAVADRIGIIHQGHLISVGTLDELRASSTKLHSLESIFLEMTDEGEESSHG